MVAVGLERISLALKGAATVEAPFDLRGVRPNSAHISSPLHPPHEERLEAGWLKKLGGHWELLNQVEARQPRLNQLEARQPRLKRKEYPRSTHHVSVRIHQARWSRPGVLAEGSLAACGTHFSLGETCPSSQSECESDIKVITVVYKGEEKDVVLEDRFSSERVEQEIRQALGLASDRVICLMDRERGGCAPTHCRLLSGTYEVMTDEEQDVASHLPAPLLRHSIRPTSTVAEVKKALSCAGLTKVLPELKKCDGAKLLSMPLDYLLDLYGYSGWRRRAARSLYTALHPPITVNLLHEGIREPVTVGSAEEFERVMSTYGAGALSEVAQQGCTCGGSHGDLLGHSRGVLRGEDCTCGPQASEGVQLSLGMSNPREETFPGSVLLADPVGLAGLNRPKLVIRFEDLVEGATYKPANDRQCWASALQASCGEA